MSEQKLREALDCICSAKLCSINSMSSRVEMLRLMDLAIDKLREALAAPAGEQVGLTEGDLWSLSQRFGFKEKRANSRHSDVRKGFCLSGAFLHYEVQRSDLVDFARAVIAAHEAKQNGGV